MLIPLVFLAMIGTQAAPPDSAVLELQNRKIFVFRAPVGAAVPEERLATALRRIREGMETASHEVTTRPTPEGSLVLVGGKPAFAVTPGDVDTAAGVSVDQRATVAASELQLAISETEESRSLSALGKGLLLSILASAVFALVVISLIRTRRRLRVWIEKRATAAVPRLTVHGITLLRADHLAQAGGSIATILAWFIGLGACYGYATYVLTRFPWTRPWGETLGNYLVTMAKRLGGAALQTIPDLITVALIVLVTRVAVRFVQSLFRAAEQRRIVLPGVHPETASPTRRLVTASLWLLALVVAYPYLPGSHSAAFKGISVFAGILITLGSAGLVGQAMSGLVLMYSRSFKVGDFVRVNQILGTVVSLGMLATRIRTIKNEYVTLPNSVVVGGSITNYSFGNHEGQPLVLYSSITIGYDTPWRKIHELLTDAAIGTEDVLPDPAPWVQQQALNDWTVEYQINVSIDPASAPKIPRIYSQLHANIQDAFSKAGVEIMSPSYAAIRDGNTPTIPQESVAKKRTPVFRVDINPE